MWSLVNRTPYAAERNWIRDKTGVHHWLVAVRAMFSVRHAHSPTLADEQLPPALVPEHYGEPGRSSLRYDSDLLALRPGTDIVLDAEAHAPGGRLASTVTASLRVGDLRKTLLVHGERIYFVGATGGLTMTSPRPFAQRPIRYEVAYGGWDASDPNRHGLDARNPVGRGFALRSERLVEKLAPAIEYPGRDPATSGPAGFGPIDPGWSPRRELAGTYDDHWQETKKPLLPDDYDERFSQSAPVDQQIVPHLRGGERVELINLTPEGLLAFDLPKLYFAFTTHFGGRAEEHRARLTGVRIEPGRSLLSMVWQTALAVRPSNIDYLDHTVIRQKEYLR
jgi:hypothetical protein